MVEGWQEWFMIEAWQEWFSTNGWQEWLSANGWLLIVALVGLSLAQWRTRRSAKSGLNGAIKELETLEKLDLDIKEWALRQTRQDVASIVRVTGLTNGLLGAILAVLIFR
jgi:hypothetical protein